MTYTITSGSPLELRIGETGVYSILQNIALLLSTKRGTVPMYRDFGLPMEYIGKPVDVAETIVFQEVSDALEEFEPRAILMDVALEKSTTEIGKLDIQVEVDIE